jgi:hypothetical protein
MAESRSSSKIPRNKNIMQGKGNNSLLLHPNLDLHAPYTPGFAIDFGNREK